MLILSYTFEQFKATLEENTSILHCRTTCCYRTTSPSTSTTLEAPTICSRSFTQDWFRVAKTSRKGYMQCSLRPWIQCSSNLFERRITTWQSPELQCTKKTIGKYIKVQYLGVVRGLLRVKDCSSIRRVRTRSSSTTFYLWCASRGWWSWSQEKAKRVNLLLHRKELYWSRNWIVNARTLQALTRESPSSDKHGGTYRETWRGEIDFRIQGLNHSVVQEHDHIRKQAVQKLIHQPENQPNKEALHEDLQQHRAYNPFSETSKEMICSMGNMEYFVICDITPNVQCSNCMTYWPKGLVYCTCGTLNSDRHDVLSIANYVILKKDHPMGDATGTRKDRDSTISPNLRPEKRRRRTTNRYRKGSWDDPIYRKSQFDIGWTEEHCTRLDEIAAEDHSYVATAAERARRENTWVFVLNSSGANGPVNQKEDLGQAHHRLHPREHVRSRPDQPFAWHDEGSESVDPKTGWKWYDTKQTPSSSSSGWQPSAWWRSSSWSQTSKWGER